MQTLSDICELEMSKFLGGDWHMSVREIGGGRGQSVCIARTRFTLILTEDDFGSTVLCYVSNDTKLEPPYRIPLGFLREYLGYMPKEMPQNFGPLSEKRDWLRQMINDGIQIVRQFESQDVNWETAEVAHDHYQNRRFSPGAESG